MQVCPSLLLKKDRGRPIDPKAKPKAYGEVSVATNVPGVELLEGDDGGSDGESDDGFISNDDDDNDGENDENVGNDVDAEAGSSENDFDSSDDDDEESDNDGSSSEDNNLEDEDGSEDDDALYSSDNADAISDGNSSEEEAEKYNKPSGSQEDNVSAQSKHKAGKRKFSDFDEQLDAANRSLRALKKLAGSKMKQPSETKDGILSNDDFQRIKELKVRRFSHYRKSLKILILS